MADRTAAQQRLEDVLLGVNDYRLHPEMGLAWGGPFNGQISRRRLLEAVLALARPAAIVETGTYLGATTELLAETGLPVFTIEANPRNYGFARTRHAARRNVTARLGDSRTELRALVAGPLRSIAGKTIFAYLDAHGGADLPLAEEIDILFGHCPAALAMIDDFEVPFDPGYGYDDYGVGLALTWAYVEPACRRFGLAAFYPATPSAEETGPRRGCVILAKRETWAEKLLATGLLREA